MSWFVTACLAISLGTSGAARAGSVWLPGTAGVNNVSVKSVQERKFAQVVRQQYDFSCGSAALATLLTYHYEDETTEQAAFGYMYEKGNQDKIRQAGFSLLDMKKFLEGNGYQADGYQANLATLADVGVPAIALINVRGYRHFVVVKGLENNEVLVGDPALGLRFIPREEFEGMWDNGILFIIRNKSELGRRYFNADDEWRLLARAPLGKAVDRASLESLSLSMPRLLDVPLD
ncbi:MAG: C39 family peptidase [Gammaproteobacteria bacterium]|nr:C39 family peptidase [Gammaproteobacteria bacterium]